VVNRTFTDDSADGGVGNRLPATRSAPRGKNASSDADAAGDIDGFSTISDGAADCNPTAGEACPLCVRPAALQNIPGDGDRNSLGGQSVVLGRASPSAWSASARG
jgi:hypothetical protein